MIGGGSEGITKPWRDGYEGEEWQLQGSLPRKTLHSLDVGERWAGCLFSWL